MNIEEQMKKVERFEVINFTGRVVVFDPRTSNLRYDYELSFQDDGKTLKVFMTLRD